MKQMHNLVQRLLEKYVGGTEYFDNLDAELRKPENFPIFEALFKGLNNVVVSGRFGQYFLDQYMKGKISVPGTIVVLNGGLRHGAKADVVFIRGSIAHKWFVFVDDSFYKGCTQRAVARYLAENDGVIIRTRVAYDGSIELEDSVSSFYRYHNPKNTIGIPFA
jgi:hypothetical protein